MGLLLEREKKLPAGNVPASAYRCILLIRKRTPLGLYRRPMLRVLGGSEGGGRFLMGEVPLYITNSKSEARDQRLECMWSNFSK